MTEFILLLWFIAMPVFLALYIIYYRKWKKLQEQETDGHSPPPLPTQNIVDIETTSYTPQFNFRSSKKFKAQWDKIKEQQNQMKADGNATYSEVDWVVGLDKKSDKNGLAMMKNIANIILLAFDKECDMLVRDVTFRNFDSFKDRMTKAYERLNKQGNIYRIFISKDYLKLKHKELHIAFEYENKLQLEKEEQQRIKEEMREQAIVEREAKREQQKALEKQKKAEKEVEEYKKLLALDKSNKELQKALAEAQKALQQAIEDGKRAISQAQLTKAGHVYVISNIGSFGENVYKIGMTRRLTPEDRVRELGDASVPFPFDIHAMIKTEDAPKMESELHRIFESKQVNRVNTRKEFFEVDLKEIAAAASKLGADVEFTMIAEASEYRQSLAMKKENRYNKIDETLDDDEDEEA